MSGDGAASVERMDGALARFEEVRPRLFGIAYRMLGSAAEAEDVVQNVWLRWQTIDRAAVVDAAAFLATATTRLAIKVLRSAHARRVEYVGPWLPEPVDTSADPGLGAERGEVLELAVLMLMESLSPRERAAYVLREAFDYPFAQIGEILQLEEANVRQLVSRARKRIGKGRRAEVDPAEYRRLLGAFVAAAQGGNLAEMEALFAADVVSYSDGGGVVRAARRAVEGREVVAKFVCRATAHLWEGVTLEWAEANGRPAVAILREGGVVGLVAVRASGKVIDQIFWVMRPSKLSAIPPASRPVFPRVGADA